MFVPLTHIGHVVADIHANPNVRQDLVCSVQSRIGACNSYVCLLSAKFSLTCTGQRTWQCHVTM